MAGVKGRSGGPRPNSGGARPGAGRKPKPVKPAAPVSESDAKAFLESVMRGEVDASMAQLKAATALLPFQHQKLGEGGKKEQRNEDAKKVGGRFAAAAPPKLAAAGGKRV